MIILLLANTVALVVGHGSLVIPPARNNYMQKDPSNISGSSHLNQGPCVGGACLWFNQVGLHPHNEFEVYLIRIYLTILTILHLFDILGLFPWL